MRALIDSPQPDLDAALGHNEFVIRDPACRASGATKRWLLRGETLLRMARPAEAAEALVRSAATVRRPAGGWCCWAGCCGTQAQCLPADSAERTAKLEAALSQFAAGREWDVENGPMTRESIYWTARCHELCGDAEAAMAQYRRLSNLYGDTDEGARRHAGRGGGRPAEGRTGPRPGRVPHGARDDRRSAVV